MMQAGEVASCVHTRCMLLRDIRQGGACNADIDLFLCCSGEMCKSSVQDATMKNLI